MYSIGIDENNSPVIFEYKRSSSENVINQGLFYLDWLLDHKADFKLLVIEKLGMEVAEQIDWSVPCLICVANDFTRYDVHAVNQMQRNIKLVKYRKYGDDLVPNQLKLYLAYKKVQNIFCIEIYNKQIIVRMKLQPDTVDLEKGFTRDTRGIGHYGTGELEVSIKNEADFQKAKPLIERAYYEA